MISEKQKECQYLVDEINSTFDIKIDSKDKSASVIWFRHYLIHKYINEPIRVVEFTLNKHYSSIIYIRKESLKFTKKQEFKDISEIIEKMDVKLYKDFISKHCKKRYDRVYDSGKEIIKIEGKPKKLQMPIGEVMILLRKNPTSSLWNKEISTWTCSDWNELKNY